MNRDDQIYTILKKLQIKACYNGYAYVKQALEICLADSTASRSVIEKIYRPIAQTNNVTLSNVESNMRHIIRNGFCHGDEYLIADIFGTTDTQTNKVFIAMLSEYIRRLEITEEQCEKES